MDGLKEKNRFKVTVSCAVSTMLVTCKGISLVANNIPRKYYPSICRMFQGGSTKIAAASQSTQIFSLRKQTSEINGSLHLHALLSSI